MLTKLLHFLKDESGATAVEYAVMLAMILLTCIASIGLFGSNTAGAFAWIRDSISVFMGGS